MEEKKKYNYMEPVLTEINSKFVALSEADTKRNNNILESIVNLVVDKMKQKDVLFKAMYTRVFFGGSYYDKLRVGQPDEFDLDLLLSLPKLVEPTITTSNMNGFVHLQFKDLPNFMKQKDLAARYKGIEKLIDDKQYLDTSQVLKWMERVVTLALNEFEKEGKYRVLQTTEGKMLAQVCKGGPAFTLKVHGNIRGVNISMDVDLVPCFVFGKEKWPVNGFRANPEPKKADYFIVPKPLKDDIQKSHRYWRLSFQEQERVIIDAKGPLKPAVRLIKKLRDKMKHKCIASYYIKTVAIWEAFDQKDKSYWSNSLSYIFMNLLIDYHARLNEGNIPYFWKKNYNLIGKVETQTRVDLSNAIKNIIKDIEGHPEDSLRIAKHLLTEAEFSQLNSSTKEVNVKMAGIRI